MSVSEANTSFHVMSLLLFYPYQKDERAKSRDLVTK
jgi:hypothetical protein